MASSLASWELFQECRGRRLVAEWELELAAKNLVAAKIPSWSIDHLTWDLFLISIEDIITPQGGHGKRCRARSLIKRGREIDKVTQPGFLYMNPP
jgi:hypothetical protein